ncbi:MAG: peptidoglycan DD-metalloendopeptidase family protein [Desulfobacter sp.]|nr:peptidoglycan DD-metalloendopeptidase family protein [Desulfobacter sp.]
MKYPYIAYSDKIDIQPVFKGLSNDPFIVDLSCGSWVFDEVNILDQKAFQSWLDRKMKDRFSWGLASYMEDRRAVLASYPQMQAEQRFYHLGLDLIVPLGTPLHAPLDGVVQESAYEQGEGNYGGNVLICHESPAFDRFYSLYGHLNRERLPAPGTRLKAGDVFAWIGDFHENGNWFYHTHLQVFTQKGYDQGWVSKGYCAAEDIPKMDSICPSPLLLFRK